MRGLVCSGKAISCEEGNLKKAVASFEVRMTRIMFARNLQHLRDTLLEKVSTKMYAEKSKLSDSV